jgi:hypothetical protein
VNTCNLVGNSSRWDELRCHQQWLCCIMVGFSSSAGECRRPCRLPFSLVLFDGPASIFFSLISVTSVIQVHFKLSMMTVKSKFSYSSANNSLRGRFSLRGRKEMYSDAIHLAGENFSHVNRSAVTGTWLLGKISGDGRLMFCIDPSRTPSGKQDD